MRRRRYAVAALVALPFLIGVPSPGPSWFGLLGPSEANATIAVLMSLDELTSSSSEAIVGRAEERFSRWEELGGAKRIVTYTRLSVERRIFGEREGTTDTVWVRTLGGSVDKIGQAVAGEAQFTIGERSVVFVAAVGDALVVTGLAQGHFPIRTGGDGVDRLASSPDAGTLLPRKGPSISAREVLLEQTLQKAAAAIEASHRSMTSN